MLTRCNVDSCVKFIKFIFIYKSYLVFKVFSFIYILNFEYIYNLHDMTYNNKNNLYKTKTRFPLNKSRFIDSQTLLWTISPVFLIFFAIFLQWKYIRILFSYILKPQPILFRTLRIVFIHIHAKYIVKYVMCDFKLVLKSTCLTAI